MRLPPKLYINMIAMDTEQNAHLTNGTKPLDG